MKVTEIQSNEYVPFYENYIKNFNHDALLDSLENSGETLIDFYTNIPESKWHYRYADGKWTVKEILTHLMDAERIFCYRALCIARQDTTNFPGFDEDAYVAESDANTKAMATLINDYKLQRQSTVALFKSFTKSKLVSIGRANSGNMSVRAIGFIIAGHEKHHIKIIEERYLD